jgi:hypothetical protein
MQCSMEEFQRKSQGTLNLPFLAVLVSASDWMKRANRRGPWRFRLHANIVWGRAAYEILMRQTSQTQEFDVETKYLATSVYSLCRYERVNFILIENENRFQGSRASSSPCFTTTYTIRSSPTSSALSTRKATWSTPRTAVRCSRQSATVSPSSIF